MLVDGVEQYIEVLVECFALELVEVFDFACHEDFERVDPRGLIVDLQILVEFLLVDIVQCLLVIGVYLCEEDGGKNVVFRHYAFFAGEHVLLANRVVVGKALQQEECHVDHGLGHVCDSTELPGQLRHLSVLCTFLDLNVLHIFDYCHQDTPRTLR